MGEGGQEHCQYAAPGLSGRQRQSSGHGRLGAYRGRGVCVAGQCTGISGGCETQQILHYIGTFTTIVILNWNLCTTLQLML